jgi:hypothetical protein
MEADFQACGDMLLPFLAKHQPRRERKFSGYVGIPVRILLLSATDEGPCRLAIIGLPSTGWCATRIQMGATVV